MFEVLVQQRFDDLYDLKYFITTLWSTAIYPFHRYTAGQTEMCPIVVDSDGSHLTVKR